MVYLLVMRQRRYFLVGPFDTTITAGVWATRNNVDRGTRWQVIELADPMAPPPVFAPSGPIAERMMQGDRHPSPAEAV